MRTDEVTTRFAGAHRLARRRAVDPLIELLRVGATPHKLAWSLALGCTVGICPLPGVTTAVVLLAAFVFRLNLLASQIANYAVYPLQLLLFFVFLRTGGAVFRTAEIPLHRAALIEAVRIHPWQTTRLLWMWEWHGIVIWLVSALLLTPCLAAAFKPLLRRWLKVMPITAELS